MNLFCLLYHRKRAITERSTITLTASKVFSFSTRISTKRDSLNVYGVNVEGQTGPDRQGNGRNNRNQLEGVVRPSGGAVYNVKPWMWQLVSGHPIQWVSFPVYTWLHAFHWKRLSVLLTMDCYAAVLLFCQFCLK